MERGELTTELLPELWYTLGERDRRERGEELAESGERCRENELGKESGRDTAIGRGRILYLLVKNF